MKEIRYLLKIIYIIILRTFCYSGASSLIDSLKLLLTCEQRDAEQKIVKIFKYIFLCIYIYIYILLSISL